MVDIPARQLPIYLFEFLVVAAGLVVWWKFQFSRSATSFRTTRLSYWNVSATTILLIGVLVIATGVVGGALIQLAIFVLPNAAQPDAEFGLMLTNLGLHLGVFAGVLMSQKFTTVLNFDLPKVPDETPVPTSAPLSLRASILAGILTFFAALPAVGLVSAVWQLALDALGVAAEKQEMLDLFGKTREPAKLVLMTAMATLLAPLTEELTFRAGIFRFCRGRIPRVWAYVIPAVVFAVLHKNLSVFAPLLTLGLFFSLVYQRTGRVLVTIIAHGLFNLNTVIVVLSGANL